VNDILNAESKLAEIEKKLPRFEGTDEEVVAKKLVMIIRGFTDDLIQQASDDMKDIIQAVRSARWDKDSVAAAEKGFDRITDKDERLKKAVGNADEAILELETDINKIKIKSDVESIMDEFPSEEKAAAIAAATATATATAKKQHAEAVPAVKKAPEPEIKAPAATLDKEKREAAKAVLAATREKEIQKPVAKEVKGGTPTPALMATIGVQAALQAQKMQQEQAKKANMQQQQEQKTSHKVGKPR